MWEVRLTTVAESREHRLTSDPGLFQLQAIVLADDSTPDSFPGGPLLGALQH